MHLIFNWVYLFRENIFLRIHIQKYDWPFKCPVISSILLRPTALNNKSKTYKKSFKTGTWFLTQKEKKIKKQKYKNMCDGVTVNSLGRSP